MLEYCDYIASAIGNALVKTAKSSAVIDMVSKTKSDLHPTEGWFQSSTKTIDVIDCNGKRYRVTVEAVE